jgi:hypothetical protein
MKKVSLRFGAASLVAAALVACGGSSGSSGATTTAVAATTASPTSSPNTTSATTTKAPSTTAPATTPTTPTTAASAIKVSANNATQAEVQAAFEAAGISNAAKWAKEVVEYRPYPSNDATFAKLRSELAKYNPSPDVVDKIVATLTP